MFSFLKKLFTSQTIEITECQREKAISEVLWGGLFLDGRTAQHVDECKICKEMYRNFVARTSNTIA